MGITEILAQIDREIARLQQARALLQDSAATTPSTARPTDRTPAKKKRNLTPEGRARIAEAVRRRWAAQKKAGSN